MDIRNNMDGLKTLLGVPEATSATAQPTTARQGTAVLPLAGDLATLSAAGAEVQQAAADSGVRADKVTSIQSVLAAGNYHVPAAAVATKVVDAMLAGDPGSEA
ncbi:MAG: flagellar biosynthesis anti-sigma factor FlgM [Terracidiphilus sp.]